MTERLTPLLRELKRASLTRDGEFSGYASTWGGPPDAHGDIIERGAFLDAIKSHKQAGTMPAMLWAHDQGEPIGRWLDVVEDHKGLLVTGKLTLDTKRGSEAYALMKDNALSMSIGFNLAPGGTRVKGTTRYITKVARLGEISLVAIPANSYARVEAMKKPETVQDFKNALRSMGFSNRDSSFVTTHGFRELLAPQEQSPLDQLTGRVDRLLNILEEQNP